MLQSTESQRLNTTQQLNNHNKECAEMAEKSAQKVENPETMWSLRPRGQRREEGSVRTSVVSKSERWDLPGGPVVKNLPFNAGGAGSAPGREAETPHAVGQLSPQPTVRDPAHGTCGLKQPEV